MDQILDTFNISDIEANDKHILNLFTRAYPHCDDCVQNESAYNQKCLPFGSFI